MSFGYSISDLVSTSALAWKLYKSCKDSSGNFKNISSEVISLHIVLKEVQDSLTCQQLDQGQEAQLESVGKGCNDVLNDLDKLLKKYGSLGTSKGSRVWDRMKWGLEDVKTMRDRLISNTTMLSAFNTALIHFSQARIEDRLNELVAGIRAGKRASTVSSHTLDSLSTNDRDAWRQLRKDLQDIGISVPILKQHQRFIIAWLQEAVRAGALEGVDEDGEMDNLRISIIGSAEDTESQWPAKITVLPETSGRLPSTTPNAGSKQSSRSPLSPAVGKLIKSDFESLRHAAMDGDVEWIKKMLTRGLSVDYRLNDRLTMLHTAARYGHEALVKLLLEHRAQNMAKDKYGLTALHLAASRPYCGVVRLLLDHQADVGAKDNQGSTALHIASKNAQGEIITLLLNKGANIAAKDNGGDTPLHSATFSGSAAIMEQLLQNGANIDEQDNTGQTALHRAACHEQPSVARALLWKEANTETKDKYGRTALQLVPNRRSAHFPYAIPHQMALKMLLRPLALYELPHSVELEDLRRVEELLSQGVDINQHSHYGGTALHLATSTGQRQMVQLLLSWGANTEVKDREGNTALHLAVSIGRKDIVNILLDNEANVEAKNANGDKVLHWAIFFRQEAIVWLLVARGANPAAMNNIQETALHAAILKGHDEIVQLLLFAGAEVNACFTGWGTPLHLAARCRYKSIVQLLLAGGADVNAKDSLGKTPLHIAASAAHPAIAELLLDRDADVAAIDNDGQTALHEAAMWGNKAVVQLLLDRGADVSAADLGGRTALHEAVMWGDEAVAQVLLDRGADIGAKAGDGVTAL